MFYNDKCYSEKQRKESEYSHRLVTWNEWSVDQVAKVFYEQRLEEAKWEALR